MTTTEQYPLTQRSGEISNQEEMAKEDSWDDDSRQSLSEAQVACYHRLVIFLAYVSIFVLLALAVTSFVISHSTKSVALFGFGFDALLDVGTSLVVVWRFYGSIQTVHSTERERIALLVLAFLFIAAALSVGIKSLLFVIKSNATEEILSLYIVSTIAVIISLMLFLSKLHVGYKLQSRTVVSDGYSSLACGIGALGVVVSAYVHSTNKDIFYLDDIVGFGIAALLMGYGVSLLVSNWKKPDGY